MSAPYLLGLFSTIAAYAAWSRAIGDAGVERISPMQFLVVNIVLAVLVLGEPLEAPVLIALLLILTGVWITRIRKSVAAGRT